MTPDPHPIAPTERDHAVMSDSQELLRALSMGRDPELVRGITAEHGHDPLKWPTHVLRRLMDAPPHRASRRVSVRRYAESPITDADTYKPKEGEEPQSFSPDTTEHDLLRQLSDNPNDMTLRGVYADWLAENGRPAFAEAVRGNPDTPYPQTWNKGVYNTHGPLHESQHGRVYYRAGSRNGDLTVRIVPPHNPRSWITLESAHPEEKIGGMLRRMRDEGVPLEGSFTNDQAALQNHLSGTDAPSQMSRRDSIVRSARVQPVGSDRAKIAHDMREAGHSLNQIADHLGVSKQRAHQLVHGYRERLKNPLKPKPEPTPKPPPRSVGRPPKPTVPPGFDDRADAENYAKGLLRTGVDRKTVARKTGLTERVVEELRNNVSRPGRGRKPNIESRTPVVEGGLPVPSESSQLWRKHYPIRYSDAGGYTEADFHRKVVEEPGDVAPLAAFSDWLRDQGETAKADVVGSHVTDNRPARVYSYTPNTSFNPLMEPGQWGVMSTFSNAGTSVILTHRLVDDPKRVVEYRTGPIDHQTAADTVQSLSSSGASLHPETRRAFQLSRRRLSTDAPAQMSRRASTGPRLSPRTTAAMGELAALVEKVHGYSRRRSVVRYSAATHADFHRQIAEDDRTGNSLHTPLVYADWLDENGMPNIAAHIRDKANAGEYPMTFAYHDHPAMKNDPQLEPGQFGVTGGTGGGTTWLRLVQRSAHDPKRLIQWGHDLHPAGYFPHPEMYAALMPWVEEGAVPSHTIKGQFIDYLRKWHPEKIGFKPPESSPPVSPAPDDIDHNATRLSRPSVPRRYTGKKVMWKAPAGNGPEGAKSASYIPRGTAQMGGQFVPDPNGEFMRAANRVLAPVRKSEDTAGDYSDNPSLSEKPGTRRRRRPKGKNPAPVVNSELTNYRWSGTTTVAPTSVRKSRRVAMNVALKFSDREGFLNVLKINPMDATAHGAYADWLDENGDAATAARHRRLSKWLQNPEVITVSQHKRVGRYSYNGTSKYVAKWGDRGWRWKKLHNYNDTTAGMSKAIENRAKAVADSESLPYISGVRDGHSVWWEDVLNHPVFNTPTAEPNE